MTDHDVQFDMWRKMTEIVEGHNDPGTFTAFIGYEWTSNSAAATTCTATSSTATARTLADQVRPFTTFDSENPEDLWEWMATYEAKTGGHVLAIPHNGNLSNGLMFALETFDGEPLDARLGRDARPLGAALRGDPDQGRPREPHPLALARPTSSPTSRSGTRATSTCEPKTARDARRTSTPARR